VLGVPLGVVQEDLTFVTVELAGLQVVCLREDLVTEVRIFGELELEHEAGWLVARAADVDQVLEHVLVLLRDGELRLLADALQVLIVADGVQPEVRNALCVCIRSVAGT
jgi:hypothetical protein